jgi:hypothetical protein
VYAFEERLASIERRLVAADAQPPDAMGARIIELERRLAALESSMSTPVAAEQTLPPERVDQLVALVVDHAPVVHLGSGDGGLLRSLRDSGVAVEGTTLDAATARASTSQGLIVHHLDALAHLTRLPAGSVGSLVLTELAPGAEPSILDDIVHLAAQRLSPGGRLVIDATGVGVAPDLIDDLVTRAGFEVDAAPSAPIGGLVIATR